MQTAEQQWSLFLSREKKEQKTQGKIKPENCKAGRIHPSLACISELHMLKWLLPDLDQMGFSFQ